MSDHNVLNIQSTLKHPIGPVVRDWGVRVRVTDRGGRKYWRIFQLRFRGTHSEV